jgi:hypothetical protein
MGCIMRASPQPTLMTGLSPAKLNWKLTNEHTGNATTNRPHRRPRTRPCSFPQTRCRRQRHAGQGGDRGVISRSATSRIPASWPKGNWNTQKSSDQQSRSSKRFLNTPSKNSIESAERAVLFCVSVIRISSSDFGFRPATENANFGQGFHDAWTFQPRDCLGEAFVDGRFLD